jgi:hypothetical protein
LIEHDLDAAVAKALPKGPHSLAYAIIHLAIADEHAGRNVLLGVHGAIGKATEMLTARRLPGEEKKAGPARAGQQMLKTFSTMSVGRGSWRGSTFGE